MKPATRYAYGAAACGPRFRRAYPGKSVSPGHNDGKIWNRERTLRPLPGRVVRDCAVVIAALGPRLVHPLKRGVFQATKFDVTRQTQSDAAKRAFVIATSSLAPNMFVIGIDNEGKRLLFHQLVRKPNPPLSPRTSGLRRQSRWRSRVH